jgi:TPR repeat protein
MDTLGSFISSIATYQSRILVPAGLKSKPRMAIPAAVLLMMLVFLFLKITEGHPPKTAAASETGAAAKLATAGDPSEALDQRSGPVPANQLSHMRVTDPAMSSELQTLSRYEIVGLRRRAVYGDDAAAFLLGMAYETGHLVPQSCVRAGEWVTKSANEGNVAAQYNLGLRYQHGDGEPVNQEVGARWLRKAAAQRYVQAQLALESAP